MYTGIGRRIVVAAVATLLILEPRDPCQCGGAMQQREPAWQLCLQSRRHERLESAPAGGTFLGSWPNRYDGQGQMKGVILVSSNGVMIPASYTGTYTLGAKCTGSKSAALSIGLTVDFDFVVDNNLRGIEMIVTQAGPANAPAGGLTISGSARKLFVEANQD